MAKDGDKARVQTLKNCMSCALCSNLLREATVISSCFHTFCRECIYQKLENDGTNCCPVCNVYLGRHPELKLRPDNTLETLRMKIFSLKNTSEPETKSSRASLTKRKEKSVSSLSITATPSASGSKKAMTRGTSQNANMSKKTETNCTGKDAKGMIKNPSSSSSRDGLNKLSTSSKKPVSLGIEDQSHDIIAQSESHAPPQCSLNNQDEGPIWQGLGVLAETANKAQNFDTVLLSVPANNMGNSDNPHKNQTRRLRKTARELKSGQSNAIVNVENDDLPSKITTSSTDGAQKINDSKEECIGASNASGNSSTMEKNNSSLIKQIRMLSKYAIDQKSGQSSTIMNVENDNLSSKIAAPIAAGALKINDSNEQWIGAPNESGSADNMENIDNSHIKQTMWLRKSSRGEKSGPTNTIVNIEDDDVIPHVKQTERMKGSVQNQKIGQTSIIVNVEDDDFPSKTIAFNPVAALKINDYNEQLGALKISGSYKKYIGAASGSSSKMDNNDNPHIKQTGRLRESVGKLKSGQDSTMVNVEDDVLPSKITTPNADSALKINDSNEQGTGAAIASGSSDDSFRRLHPVWFVLHSCEDTRGTPFPQIPKKYLRVKDGNMPVAFVSRYVAQKLDHTHESEVEIMCCGQVIPPDARLLDLVHLWESSNPNMVEPVDYVIVLTYRRK